MQRPWDADAPRSGWTLAALTLMLVVGWLGAVFLFDPVRFVVFNPRGKTGFEMFLALGQLFGALVLALSSGQPARPRMRWLATGLFVLGIGAMGFGYVFPLIEPATHLNVSTYGSLLVRSVATILIAIGLVPTRVPPLHRNTVLGIMLAGGLVSLLLFFEASHLPPLVNVDGAENLTSMTAVRSFPGLTGWHYMLGIVPLLPSVAAVWGAVQHHQGKVFGGWLVVGTTLLAGAQLHSLFWPSMYSSVLTTTSVLRFGLTVIIIAGGVFELRYLSIERANLLADEQERVRQLEELGRLKRDFTSIVAHELATPLAAIANLAQMISMDVLGQAERKTAADRITGEARILQMLVRDIQASADVERDNFEVSPRPVPLRSLLEDASAYARTVGGEHPLTMTAPGDLSVLADPERIGQVIRNLINNAIRHTPAGTPITLRATREPGGIRIAVEDLGPGIDPADRERILEKFARGRDAGGQGRGLGLYLSRRILQAHGTELSIDSRPGHGSRFGFVLRECA